MSEKNRRIYYQDIVYKVCNLLDKHYGRKPGTGLVCGTLDEPSSEVQDELAILLNEHATLKRENERLTEYAAILDYWFNPDKVPVNVKRVIGALRVKCASLLTAEEQDDE